MPIIKSILIFILAGLCEIGGGYLVWLCIKEEKPLWYGIIGFIILALYGVVATLQTSDFAKVYATYGGFLSQKLTYAGNKKGTTNVFYRSLSLEIFCS